MEDKNEACALRLHPRRKRVLIPLADFDYNTTILFRMKIRSISFLFCSTYCAEIRSFQFPVLFSRQRGSQPTRDCKLQVSLWDSTFTLTLQALVEVGTVSSSDEERATARARNFKPPSLELLKLHAEKRDGKRKTGHTPGMIFCPRVEHVRGKVGWVL